MIGGGLPVGAFGGRAELTEALAPTGPVYQAGTLSGNPLATAAGLAVLRRVSDADYATLAERAERFAAGARARRSASGGPRGPGQRGRPAGRAARRAARAPTRPLPGDLDDVRAVAADGAYPALFHALLARGVALAPGPLRGPVPGPRPRPTSSCSEAVGGGRRSGGRGGGPLGVTVRRWRRRPMRSSTSAAPTIAR